MKFRNYLIIEKTTKPIGIFIGRVTPPTIAHWKIIRSAEEKYSKVYIIIIEGIDTSKLEKNFLSFKDRVDILKITNPRSKPILARKGYIPDIITDNKIDTSNGIAIIAGSDRIDGYKRQFKNADYKVIFDEIKRTASDVSASKVRQAIANDDFDTYKRMIAPGLDNEKWFKLFQKGMKIKGFEMLESAPVYKTLFEAVNKHMEHFEDSVFDGQDGIKRNIEMVGPIFDTLNGTGKNITMKWDGCIHPDTIILTDKGDIKIKDMLGKTGINILTYDINNNIVEYNEAIKPRVNHNNKNWVEVYFENGNKVIVTEDHEFYTTNRGWIKAIDLTENDDIKEIPKK